MLEIISELAISSSLLDVALDRYQRACSAAQAYYSRPTAPIGTAHPISSYIAREIVAATSYETKIKQAKSTIGQTRNHSFIHSKIHGFPTEVLAHIFQLVASPSCGVEVGGTGPTALPKYPERLSHVCSRWRRVALNLPALWTHIDLIYAHPLGPAFVNRAQAFVSRTGTLPLDIHLQVPTSHDIEAPDLDVCKFLKSVAYRVGSFKWSSPNSTGFEGILVHAFESLFSGKLVRLNMTDYSSDEPGFLIASSGSDEDLADSVSPVGPDLYMSRDAFEKLLRSVKILQLKGVYPYWTSQAYHGLAELRLSPPDEERFEITSSELSSILQNSPGLTVLHFGLHIIPHNWAKSNLPRICLTKLGELNLSHLARESQLALFFSLLAPVSNPLRVTITLDKDRDILNPFNDETVRFLESSHIAGLHLDGSRRRLAFGNFLTLLPRLQVLTLRNFYRGFGSQPALSQAEGPTPCALPCLEVIYVLDSDLDLAEISRVIKKNPLRTMILWKVDMYANDSWLMGSELVAELHILCPTAKCIEMKAVDPIKDWD